MPGSDGDDAVTNVNGPAGQPDFLPQHRAGIPGNIGVIRRRGLRQGRMKGKEQEHNNSKRHFVLPFTIVHAEIILSSAPKR